MRGHSTAMGYTPSGGPKPLVTTWPLVALPVVALPRLLQPWAPSVGAVRGGFDAPRPLQGVRPRVEVIRTGRVIILPPTSTTSTMSTNRGRKWTLWTSWTLFPGF